MRPIILALAAAGLLLANVASAQRAGTSSDNRAWAPPARVAANAPHKAETRTEKTFIWKKVDNNGQPLPSLFWLPSGKHGQRIEKQWGLRNGVRVQQTKELDENNKLISTERTVIGKAGHRNKTVVRADMPYASQTKSWHAKDTRFSVTKTGTSLKDLAGKAFTQRRGISKKAPIGYKGGGPIAPMPIYE